MTVSFSLFLNHRLVQAYQQSMRANQKWVQRLKEFSQIGKTANQVNLAGNDVFESHDPGAERAKLHDAYAEFTARLTAARKRLPANTPVEQAAKLQEQMRNVRRGMDAQVAEAERIFDLFAAGHTQAAGSRMAKMDRHNARLNAALSTLNELVAEIQAGELQFQARSARTIRVLEYVVVVAVALLVCGVASYGYKLAREMDILGAQLQAFSRRQANVAQLATGVAHELRNPLTSVKMLIQGNRQELAEQGMPSQDLEIVEQEIRRMERSLGTFLEYARPRDPERRSFSLPELIERTVALLQGRAKQQQVIFDVRTSLGEVMLVADRDQIQQVLLNLLLNALDALPHGGTVKIRTSHDADRRIELQVEDSGLGIDPKILPQLFEPFSTTKETGTGLGLAVSKRIAESHGGSLSAGNRPAGGACFVLSLPAAGMVEGECLPPGRSSPSPVV